MKRKLSVALLILMMITCGCSPSSVQESMSPADTSDMAADTVLKWLIPTGVSHVSESFVNKLLREKGLPYTIEFVKKGIINENGNLEGYLKDVISAKDNGEQADLIFSGYGYIGSIDLPVNRHFVTEDVYLPLNPFLESELGYKLHSAYHELIWESLNINGSIYGIPLNDMSLWRKVIIYNQEMANKYNIDPVQLTRPLWELEPLLKEIRDGERENLDFVPVEWPEPTFLVHDYTMVSSMYMINIDELGDDLKAVNKFETGYMKKLWDTIQDFQVKGYIETMEKHMQNTQNADKYFDNFFMRYDQILCDTYFDRVFADTGMTYVNAEGKNYASDLNYVNNGIASWSEHPEEAFEVVATIMTDADLSNAFTWGVEGFDYDLVDGRAVETGSHNIIFSKSLSGNKFISYPGYYEPTDKQTELNKVFSDAKKSKLFGFYFDRRSVAGEVLAVYKVYDDIFLSQREGDWFSLSLDEINKRFRDAGIDDVLDEINRQISEWDAQKEES